MENSTGHWIVENLDSLLSADVKNNVIEITYNSSGYWIIENNNLSSDDTENNFIEQSLNCFKLPQEIKCKNKVSRDDSSNGIPEENSIKEDENSNFSKLITSNHCDENTTDNGLSIASSKHIFINVEASLGTEESLNHLGLITKNQHNDKNTNFDKDLKNEGSFNSVKLIESKQCDGSSSDDVSAIAISEKSLSEVNSFTDTFGLIKENKSDDQIQNNNLLIAITDENLTEVMKIINSNLDNPSCENVYTALQLAVQNNCKEIITFLIEKITQINCNTEKSQNTPLHLAVIQNNHDIVKMLLAKKADVNKKNALGQSPLDIALTDNNIIILKLFVEHLSDINITEENYVKLLFYLFDKDYLQLTTSLLTKCSHIDLSTVLKNSNLLCRAVEKEHYSIVKNLLDRDADVNCSYRSYFGSRTALYIACEKGNCNLVKLLLSKGADVNIASEIFNYETVFNYYPIRPAIESGHYLIVKVLIDYETDINKCYDGFSPLHLACNFCQTQIVKLLIHQGANINVKNDLGISPISIAAKRGYIDIFKYLIENEDFHLDYDNAEFILHCVTKNNFFKILELIMSYINELNNEDHLRYEIDTKVINNLVDFSLLHTAARFDSDNCIDILVQSGASVNCKDKDGKTPLHVAYQYGRQKSVVSLLKNGADINAICDKGYTPFEYSRVSKKSESYLTNYSKYHSDESNIILDERSADEMSSYFAKHIAKMKIINLDVNTKNYDALIDISSRMENLFQQQEEYNIEVETMKTEVIVSSSAVTYYDFVKANLRLRVWLLNDENILKILEIGEYNSMFPHYSTIISGCYQRALAKKKLLDETEKYPIFDSIQELPDPCIDMIIYCLSDSDLRTLINKNKFFNNDK